MPQPLYLPVSARTGEGMDRWLAWLEQARMAPRSNEATQRTLEPGAFVVSS